MGVTDSLNFDGTGISICAYSDMRLGGRDIDAIVERALLNREVCLERARVAPTPELAEVMQRIAEYWDGFAVQIRRDAEVIAASRRLLAEANELLKSIEAASVGDPWTSAPPLSAEQDPHNCLTYNELAAYFDHLVTRQTKTYTSDRSTSADTRIEPTMVDA